MLLHVEHLGDPNGSPLVCLHGLTGYGLRFRRLGELLPGRRLIAPDLRGHGGSGREPPWDVATHVADVTETVDWLGIERADWLGFSYGGRVLAELAAREPQRFERLCLLDPALDATPELCLELAEDELAGESFESHEEAVETTLASGLLFHTPRELIEEDVLLNLVRREDGRLEYRYHRGMSITAFSEIAREPPPVADLPTLVVTGDRSWLRVDLRRYPDAKQVTVPGGHSVLMEALEETAAAVRDFLSE